MSEDQILFTVNMFLLTAGIVIAYKLGHTNGYGDRMAEERKATARKTRDEWLEVDRKNREEEFKVALLSDVYEMIHKIKNPPSVRESLEALRVKPKKKK